MSNGRADDRRGVGLLWLVAAVGTGAAIWAACTDFGALSYRTCTAESPYVSRLSLAPGTAGPRIAAPGVSIAAAAAVLGRPAPRAAPGPTRSSAARGVLACSA